MTVTRMAFVLFAALLLQTTVFAQLTVMGVHADLMLLIAIAAGITAGPERGAIVGFVAGTTYDLVLETPFGLSSLVCALAGFAVGSLQETWDRPGRILPTLVAAGASAAGVVAYATLGEVLGQDYLGADISRIALFVAVINGLLAPGARRIVAWALAPGRPGVAA